jgi:hypothetical protein
MHPVMDPLQRLDLEHLFYYTDFEMYHMDHTPELTYDVLSHFASLVTGLPSPVPSVGRI